MLQETPGNAPQGVAAHYLMLVWRVVQELAFGCGGWCFGGGGSGCRSAGKREQQAGCAKLFHGFSGSDGEAKERLQAGHSVMLVRQSLKNVAVVNQILPSIT
jgi:hypothetical protein